jgi:hypothetical protein
VIIIGLSFPRLLRVLKWAHLFDERTVLNNADYSLVGEGFVRLCGLVVRVPSYRSEGPGSVPGATKVSEK